MLSQATSFPYQLKYTICFLGGRRGLLGAANGEFVDLEVGIVLTWLYALYNGIRYCQ